MNIFQEAQPLAYAAPPRGYFHSVCFDRDGSVTMQLRRRVGLLFSRKIAERRVDREIASGHDRAVIEAALENLRTAGLDPRPRH